MDQRKATLLRSVLSLVGVVAVGGGITYAAFTSNTVGLTTTAMTTGQAEIKICNSAGTNDWKTSIAPALSLDDLLPGGPEQAITTADTIYLGNDNGSLATEIDPKCASYASALGSSVTDMDIVPVVSSLSCPLPILETQMKLRFEIGGIDTGSFSLAQWEANAAAFSPSSFLPGQVASVQMFGSLDASATDQDATCTFDLTFQGKQA